MLHSKMSFLVYDAEYIGITSVVLGHKAGKNGRWVNACCKGHSSEMAGRENSFWLVLIYSPFSILSGSFFLLASDKIEPVL
jgi:hypothetical protein